MPPEDDPIIPSDTPENLNETAESAAKVSQNLQVMSGFATDAHESLMDLNTIANTAQKSFGIFDDSLKKLGISLDNTQALTEQQSAQFGLLSVAVLGARKSFDSFQNIDTGNLSTITNQIEYLAATFATGEGGVAKLVQALQSGLGINVPKSAQTSVAAVKDFAAGMLISADNALRVQNAYIQLSARTGNLGEVFAAAGPNLEHLNSLLEKQTAMMSDAVKATGLAPEVIQKYYSELGAVPKALQEVIEGTGGASQGISLLTGSIKVATGTGRSYADVVDDMKLAFKDYNLTGEDALQFTARMSEISNKFGANLDVVRNSLRGTADVFKMFGNEAEASAKILNSYVGALQSTGLSGDAAVDVVSNMTNAVGQLNIAQKAFLSAQTGGGGGLMGAFQIDKLLREGKLDEVFEKVRQQMTRQFGRIVSLDEASQSQGAANQMTRQMMLLRQGPLGQFARTDVEAQRILEAFRARQEGRATTTGLDPKIVQSSVDKGTMVQEKSYTELSRIRSILEAARGAADIANLGFIQQGLTAGMGTTAALTPEQERAKANLRGVMEQGALRSGETTTNLERDITTRAPVKDLGRRAAQSLSDFEQMFKQIPDSLKAPLDALKNAISAGKSMNVNAELKALQDEINNAKTQAAKTQAEQVYQAALKTANIAGYATERSPETAGSQVGIAASRAITTSTAIREPEMRRVSLNTTVARANEQTEAPQNIKVDISVSDDRITYKVSPNTIAVNPASTLK